MCTVSVGFKAVNLQKLAASIGASGLHYVHVEEVWSHPMLSIIHDCGTANPFKYLLLPASRLLQEGYHQAMHVMQSGVKAIVLSR